MRSRAQSEKSKPREMRRTVPQRESTHKKETS